MNSKVTDAIGLKTNPVALIWSNTLPENSISFKPGRWGCVMAVLATVAAKGRVGAFSRETYGCWGGGVGLGFGNCYQTFPGGIAGFCGFLANGNKGSAEGRAIGEQMATWGGRSMADDFLEGEGIFKTLRLPSVFLSMCQCVIFQPSMLSRSRLTSLILQRRRSKASPFSWIPTSFPRW